MESSIPEPEVGARSERVRRDHPRGDAAIPGLDHAVRLPGWGRDHAERARCPSSGPALPGGTLNVTLSLTGQTKQFDFSPASGQSWPDYRPYGIVLMPGPAQAMTTDAATRLLTFALTKGDTVAVQLSSYMNDSDLLTFGLVWWIADTTLPARRRHRWGFDRRGPRLGVHPWTNLQLVYAVQKPLLRAGARRHVRGQGAESDLCDRWRRHHLQPQEHRSHGSARAMG